MIIGISGKKGSGKDTVAEIIRYLVAQQRAPGNPILNDDFESALSFARENSKWAETFWEGSWEIRRFADELKKIAASILGVPVEQLEDRSFKNQDLGDRWAKWIVQHKEFPERYMIFAEEAGAVDYLSLMSMELQQDYELREQRMTPRKFMQQLGTEAGRQIIHPNIWVNATLSNYRWEGTWSEIGERKYQADFPRYIIPDVRFENEADAIKNRNGLIVRVNRLTELRLSNLWDQYIESEFQEWDQFLMSMDKYDEVYHPSETELDKYDGFDAIISNNNSINGLVDIVETVLAANDIIN